MGDPLCMTNHFSLADFRVLPLSLAFDSLFICLSVGPFGIILVGVLWDSWIFCYVFSQIGDFYSHYFYQQALCSFLCHFSYWEFHNAYESPVSQRRFLSLSSLLFFFSLLWLDDFKRPVFKVIDSFFCLIKPLLNHCNTFFSPIIVNFNSRICLVLFIISISSFIFLILLTHHYSDFI